MDGQKDEGWTTEPAYTISSPGAFGSGELRISSMKKKKTGGVLINSRKWPNRDSVIFEFTNTFIPKQKLHTNILHRWEQHSSDHQRCSYLSRHSILLLQSFSCNFKLSCLLYTTYVMVGPLNLISLTHFSYKVKMEHVAFSRHDTMCN